MADQTVGKFVFKILTVETVANWTDRIILYEEVVQ